MDWTKETDDKTCQKCVVEYIKFFKFVQWHCNATNICYDITCFDNMYTYIHYTKEQKKVAGRKNMPK